MDYRDYVAWACDQGGFSSILAQAEKLRGFVGIIKLNSVFISQGRHLVERLAEMGFRIWIDLKFNDIPATVELEVRNTFELTDVSYCTIHLSGTREMISAAVTGLNGEGRRNQFGSVLGITVLTSVSQEEFNEEMTGSIEDCVYHRTKKGVELGIDGIVCSGREVARIRQEFGSGLIIACPGIRVDGRIIHDQKRVTTPYQAIKAGASLLVMGRDLDPNNKSKLIEIHRQIENGLKEYHPENYEKKVLF